MLNAYVLCLYSQNQLRPQNPASAAEPHYDYPKTLGALMQISLELLCRDSARTLEEGDKFDHGVINPL